MSEIAPVTLQAPYTLRFTFRGQVRPKIKALPGIAAIDDKTYELKGGDLHKMWELVNDACCNWLVCSALRKIRLLKRQLR